MKECSVDGCQKATTRWGSFCPTHRNRKRRHGHPLQTAVTKGELAPYRKLVRERRERNAESAFWTSLEVRWQTAVDRARDLADGYRSGRPMNRTQRQTCEELARIGDDVDPSTVTETALAMIILHEHMPHRFKSDEAFWHQIARRARGLTDLNAGSWYDAESGKVKRVYRDIPAKVSVEIGKTLVEVFGFAGLLLAKKEKEDLERKRRELQELKELVEVMR